MNSLFLINSVVILVKLKFIVFLGYYSSNSHLHVMCKKSQKLQNSILTNFVLVNCLFFESTFFVSNSRPFFGATNINKKECGLKRSLFKDLVAIIKQRILKSLDLELMPFVNRTVFLLYIVGVNGSGKSNFFKGIYLLKRVSSSNSVRFKSKVYEN